MVCDGGSASSRPLTQAPIKQETHHPGHGGEPEERPLWNSGDKVITREMSALWLCPSRADPALWDESVLCEETEREALGVALFFWKVTPGVWAKKGF